MKKTIFIGSPAYLRTSLRQLEIESTQRDNEPRSITKIPLEDIGIIVLEHPQITLTHTLISALVAQNAAIVTCSEKFMPNGLMLNLDGNTLQSQRFQAQTEASLPLKKQLWAQTVQSKIRNQARVLIRRQTNADSLLRWSTDVRSGDPDNIEAKAAAWYWPRLFPWTDCDAPEDWGNESFIRDRYGDWPNSLLNYGYAILRAVIARALIGAGLLPTLGIHHKNKYNAYCLADDIMEPYRPSVDLLVCKIRDKYPDPPENQNGAPGLSSALKKELLVIPVMDVLLENKTSPLQEAARKTAASLAQCFTGQERKILYPETI